MTDQPSASRPPPPNVRPVKHEGIRYEQDLDSPAQGGLGGHLIAKDQKSGKTLWTLKVYDVKDESASGVDRIGLYFRSMKLAPGGKELLIVDEAGRRFTVDLVARRVTSEPPAPAPSSKPISEKPAPD